MDDWLNAKMFLSKLPSPHWSNSSPIFHEHAIQGDWVLVLDLGNLAGTDVRTLASGASVCSHMMRGMNSDLSRCSRPLDLDPGEFGLWLPFECAISQIKANAWGNLLGYVDPVFLIRQGIWGHLSVLNIYREKTTKRRALEWKQKEAEKPPKQKFTYFTSFPMVS